MSMRPSRLLEPLFSNGVIGGLQRRLLVLLLATIALIAVISVAINYQAAGTAALQQDQRLQRLVPLLADSVVKAQIVGPRSSIAQLVVPDADDLIQQPGLSLLLAPSLLEFLQDSQGAATLGVLDAQGSLLLGERWLPTVLPTTDNAEFLSVVEGGVTYRLVAQRVQTDAGELVVMLADGTDPRQHWLRDVLTRVLLPNLLLFVVAAAAVIWGVARALQPLIDLKQVVESRAPGDLRPFDAGASPAEVRPLVDSLNRLLALVDAQTDAQRRFVADAAHQLRTPLAGLQAQVEAWAQGARSLGSGDLLTLRADQVLRLRAATRRTSQLANQLLALSRADTLAGDSHARQQVDLVELCETALDVHLDAATERGLDFGLEVQPARTLGHAWLLRELLMNLVDNAVKYTPAGGRVTLRCGHGTGPSAFTWIEVEDDGPGIPQPEHERVLQRFYRVPGTVGEGNGLGLAIADSIARVHQTRLEFAAGSSGRGLRIRVMLNAATH
ncbi:ATP-binding protein [uncultured Hydrogenophaga sp.]|uniref:ATP-binding protein n=1 Tax=uncultured Hydrogenophaga sp. TaxID=199683 RepID=UPI00265FFB97|nr:ATP-binding protein [uncultured Hydrogenophaga sp.]